MNDIDREIATGRLTGLRYGDIVENHWASKDNPIRISMFLRYVVRQKTECLQCLSQQGEVFEMFNDKRSRTVKIGSVHEEIKAALAAKEGE